MSLQEQLASDLKEAMLAGNAQATSTLRLLKAELQNTAISLGSELDDQKIEQVIRKEIKKRREAAVTFTTSGNNDRAATETAEADFLQKYVPEAVSEEEIRAFISAHLEANPGLDSSHKGEVIRATLTQFAGRADGKLVSELVNTSLNS